MYHHWGCTQVYRPLSYPFRTLPKITHHLGFQDLVVSKASIFVAQQLDFLTIQRNYKKYNERTYIYIKLPRYFNKFLSSNIINSRLNDKIESNMYGQNIFKENSQG